MLDPTHLLATATPQADMLAVNSIWDFVLKGGVMMIPIGVCSLIVLAVVLERTILLRRSRIAPAGLTARVGDVVDRGAKGKAAALELCERDGSPLAAIFTAGIRQMGRSMSFIEKHMAARGEQEVFGLRRRLRALSVIAAVSPLLGLVGTIFGMIKAFQTVAVSQESLGKAELLAEGIYEAMITTAAGLLVAIPTLIFYHWISGKIDRLVRILDSEAVAFAERLGVAASPELAEVERELEDVDEESPSPSLSIG